MRIFPWRDRPFLDAEQEAWQAETWAWFLDQFGGIDDLRRSPLVTPSRAFFPPTEATGHERALHVFAQIRRHARLDALDCLLEAQPPRPDARVGEVTALRFATQDPAGTFRVEGNAPVITYDPGALDEPAVLVATLAHELCHYRLKGLRTLPPGGEALEEPATDLATVYLGFGLFGASVAFRYQQFGDSFSQGWRSARLGYLGQRAWCYALAIFFLLREEDIAPAKAFLLPHLFSDLRSATAYLRRHPDRLPARRSP